MGIASGNLWLVWLGTFILQPMEHTNHKFPAAMAKGVPSEVKSTVVWLSGIGLQVGCQQAQNLRNSCSIHLNKHFYSQLHPEIIPN